MDSNQATTKTRCKIDLKSFPFNNCFILGGNTPPLPCFSACIATSRHASRAPQYNRSTAGSVSSTVSNFSRASFNTADDAVRLLDVVCNNADVSEAGDVRESKCRDLRDNPSHVRHADFVEEFIVDSADVKADILSDVAMPPRLGRGFIVVMVRACKIMPCS